MSLNFFGLRSAFVVIVKTLKYFVAVGRKIVDEFAEVSFLSELVLDGLVQVQVPACV